MSLNIFTLGSSKTYTNMVALGISSAVVDDTNKSITFTLAADGSKHTIHFNQPTDGKDGVSITSIDIDSDNNLVCTMSDGTEQKAKIDLLDNVYTKTETDTLLLDKAEKNHNHDSAYASKDTEHKHSNKETLDKFGVNDGGKLTFNGDVVTPEAMDLGDYLKKTDAQNTYVEKETGKGLSENDFTTVLKDAYDKAVEDSHTHTNKSIIDKFSESADGALLYNGQSIEADLSTVYKKTETYSQTESDDKFVAKESGKGLSTNDYTTEEKEKLAGLENYDDAQIKTQIQAVANGLMDSVGYSADYKSIDIIAKNGVKKSVNVAPIISHASITELSDVDTTNKATGKALVYNATTSKHEYADVSGTDEKVKMDASTDAKYLGELLDNITIANENSELKVKKLDGQEVTITEINYLKGLTMNVMDLVNMFSNGGVKIINTPVATYAELLTLDKSSFIEGISYLVYVLADENHDNAKTTYLVDKDSETPTYFGFADSQRDFTTNPIDLATEITGKLGIANMDSDAIKALFTVDDTYKTETKTNNAFSTHGAKALYDELLFAIGNKANDSDLTAHKDDTDIHVSTEDRTKWDSAKTHADSAHAPSNAQENVLETVKVNGTALEVSDKAVNVTVPTTVAELTDSADYAKKTDLHSHDNKSVLDGITSDKVTAWDNKSEFSGSYNDLNDKPTIDAELSNTSENAIQNKVVTKEINKLYSDISFNDFDTATDGISFTDAEDGNMIVTDWTKNLLNTTLKTHERYGTTCTQNVDTNGNPDGTYTINGTSTKDRWISFGYTTLNPGKYKFIATENNVGVNNLSVSLNGIAIAKPGDIFTIQSKSVCDIGLSTFNKTFNNVLIKPMITTDLSATYDDFVPYGGYEIQSCGKNLLNPTLETTTKNGVTCTNNGDGTYTLNGTNSDNEPHIFSISRVTITSEDRYKLVGCPANKSANTVHMFLSNSGYSITLNDFGNGEYKILPSGVYGIRIEVRGNETINNEVFKPMLTTDLSATYDDFEPYQGESIKVANGTESPAFGLKSRKGITNIISPGNVKCVYPTNESGKGVLDSLYNKDKMLTEQKNDLGGLTFSASGATLSITDGTNTWTLGANS